MAQIYRNVKGRPLTKYLATLDGVQEVLEDKVTVAAAAASAALFEHRQDGHSTIEIDHGKVDWYLTLSDERGDKAAMSIEYGRAAGGRWVKDKRTGNPRWQSWGEAPGLFILHDAIGLTRKRKAKVKVKEL